MFLVHLGCSCVRVQYIRCLINTTLLWHWLCNSLKYVYSCAHFTLQSLTKEVILLSNLLLWNNRNFTFIRTYVHGGMVAGKNVSACNEQGFFQDGGIPSPLGFGLPAPPWRILFYSIIKALVTQHCRTGLSYIANLIIVSAPIVAHKGGL